MRIAILTLAVFCAVISGWTASLAQIQDLGGTVPAHHKAASTPHAVSAHARHDPCPATVRTCDHHSGNVHPVLCAACFAVASGEIDMTRDALPSDAVRPAPQERMRATAVKPRFPPPRSSG